MSLHAKLKTLLESLLLPSNHGHNLDTSIISLLQEEKDFTTLINSLTPCQQKQIKNLVKNRKSVIAEFLQSDKKTTWKDKYNLCDYNFHIIRSLLTSVLELTLNGKVCSNFWNCATSNLSRKLLLPTETVSADLPSNSSNGKCLKTKSNSWFSIKDWNPQIQSLQMTSCPSSMFSIAECKEKENTKLKLKIRNRSKKVPSNCSRKYRLYMNKETKQQLKQWFGCVRKTYNLALAGIKEKQYPIDRYWLRNRFVNACNVSKQHRYLLETPKHVREGAVDELVDAFKINFKRESPFEIKFRSKKKDQSIVIPHSSISSYKNNNLRLYPTMLSSSLKMYAKINITFDYDCRMEMNRLGQFYLLVPFHKTLQSVYACDNQAGIVALDPGVRTFLTSFGIKSNETIIRKIGDHDMTRIYRLCIHLDNLVSKYQKNKKQSFKMAERRLRKRIKNLVKEVHCQSASWLCKTFKNVIIPPFAVSNMVKKEKRCITKKTVRQMLTWSHYSFRQRLIYKATQLGSTIHVLGEEYTTKVCTNCGFYNPRIKGEKILNCPCCRIKVDRDISGARNIFMKNVSC